MTEFWEVLQRHLPVFASGFFTTVKIVGASFLIAITIGTFVAAFRVAPTKWLNRLGGLYVEFFRNIPLLILLFIIFYGLPESLGIDEPIAGVIGLGLYTAAYVAETVRSGVFAVGKGQIDASLSLGFTYAATLRRIVLPQAFRTVIPPLGSLTIAMIKNSAIIGGALAVDDLMHAARKVNSGTYQTTEAFFWAAVGYLILTVTATVIVKRLETRLAVRR